MYECLHITDCLPAAAAQILQRRVSLASQILQGRVSLTNSGSQLPTKCNIRSQSGKDWQDQPPCCCSSDSTEKS